MPRERQEIFRNSNTKEKERIFVLAFEGNITESHYFSHLMKCEYFNDELIYLHLLTRKKNDTNSAPSHVFSKLKREAKDEYAFNNSDELWMIIDTDKWKNINEIIDLCKKEKNMFVACSNPSFELWLLLHILDLETIDDQVRTELLTNRKVSKSKNYIDKLLGDLLDDGYNKTKPRPNRFLPHIKIAIERAKKLAVSDEDYPLGLGSHIYKVVEKLLKQ